MTSSEGIYFDLKECAILILSLPQPKIEISKGILLRVSQMKITWLYLFTLVNGETIGTAWDLGL